MRIAVAASVATAIAFTMIEGEGTSSIHCGCKILMKDIEVFNSPGDRHLIICNKIELISHYLSGFLI